MNPPEPVDDDHQHPPEPPTSDSVEHVADPDVVGRTDSVGQAFDDGEGRIFPCEGCGADLEFHIGDQQLSCPYCGHVREISFAEDAEVVEQDFNAMLQTISGWRRKAAQKRKQESDADEAEEDSRNELRCDSCGVHFCL